ncbi:MAG: Fpg/Nei family DNA glycosylase [Actinobacteria bacterium]|nr:Fpg/Nei family DNA glycosylase [Actinomycetota bacterium]
MPEGDVVWWTARRLHEALAGRKLTISDFRVPRFATTDLTGREVREVRARGKHLLIRVAGEPPLTVHTHLRMEGRWRIRRAAGQRPPGSHQVRLVLGNETWQAVGYQLGVVQVLRTAQEDRVTGHLGPDLLGPDWDPGEAVGRLRAVPDRPVGEAIMDQRNLAGVGNLYKSEVLFLRGVSPWRPAGDLDDQAAAALVELARQLLDANKDRVGQVTTGRPGRGNETWVYGRRGLGCRRCGSTIRSAEQGAEPGERVTYWCPHCQR